MFFGAYYALIDFARTLAKLENKADYVVISVDEKTDRTNNTLKCESAADRTGPGDQDTVCEFPLSVLLWLS